MTLRPIDFRSCRDTGITWLAIETPTHRGLSLQAMQIRCGHEDLTTTNGYVKMAEDRSGTIGEPFPPLPGSLLRSSNNRLSVQETAKNKCRRRESNAPRSLNPRGFRAIRVRMVVRELT